MPEAALGAWLAPPRTYAEMRPGLYAAAPLPVKREGDGPFCA
jgi:hypothetical protein